MALWLSACPDTPTQTTQTQTPTAVVEAEPVTLPAITTYATLTVVLIIALFLTMRALGQQPLYILNPDTKVGAGWQTFTDQEIRYTLEIPNDWTAWDKQQLEARPTFTDLLQSEPQLTMAVMPFDTFLTDMEIIMVVMGENPAQITDVPGFVIVAQSDMIGRLSSEVTLILVQQANPPLILKKSELAPSFMGDERLVITLEMPQTKDELTCQQHIINNQERNYLLAGCAPSARYGSYGQRLDEILASFQPLQ